MSTRRTLLASAAIFTLSAAATAAAQEKVLSVAAYGGSFEQLMREQVFPAFEKEHNVRIEYTAGNSTDTLARLVATKSGPQIDVAIMDDGPMYQAIALGLCQDLTSAPVYGDLYDTAKVSGNKATGLGVVATGLMYNTDYFKQQGWDAPTSWADLKDAKYKGKLVVPPLSNTYGLHALIMEAGLAGGSEQDIDPGFKAFTDEIGPNVLAYEPSPGQMTALFQNGQAVLSVWGSARINSLKTTGFPVQMVYPKEGAVALGILGCPVAGRSQPEAQAFLQYLLSPEVQQKLAIGYGYGPVNKNAKLTDEQAADIPYGPERVGKLRKVDWDYVNQHREEWNTRWTREVER
ncbi:ABC transporter substrate-binding protein [Mangrovibrevibacter kandeliae]|uniref:ABC transporter substrate-binding protein n=1 Tax=Mangrovibrevibacter kandeliae TaxID=2968473 RepID=UPI0021197727|nr:ABC transporter substrate-binding protein [Aurantimonas sp. CSK15Z-1]MCQ8780657.1 ABC transporter substrate-binding protein [Aurantimonas sp. CSK15Z-1]